LRVRHFADGADVVDCLIEIPLPGRTLRSAPAHAAGHPANMSLPSFVAGPENHLVATAVSRLLEAGRQPPHGQSGRRSTARVLALYGESGTGKTHLARGAVAWWQDRGGADTAEYMTAADFRCRWTEACDADDVAQFRRRIRGLQLLAIDDLHRLPANEYLQQELRYTIDACNAAGAWLLVTSGRPASTLANLSPDVRSRLAAGLVLQLAPPGAAARGRIVEQASQALGWSVPQDVVGRLAAGISGTASDLFGALFALHAAVPHPHCWRTEHVDRYLAEHEPRRPPLREIIAVVAKYHGVPQKVLKSSARKQAAVTARAMAVYLARELASASYERIGHALGGRDHTTMMHSYRKIHRQLQHDPATRDVVADLRRMLSAR
jgi:chromosomal replication initiator protein